MLFCFNAARIQRDGEVLLDDVVDRLVPLHERRPEVEGEDALHVIEVLRVPGPVEVVLPVEVALDRDRDGALGDLERIPLDLPHHDEGHEDDQEDDRDRPQSPPDDELEHGA